MSGNPWSSDRGRAEESDEDVPAWRRPSQEPRPFTRQPPGERPSGEIRPFPEQGDQRPFGAQGDNVRPFPDQGRPEPQPPPQQRLPEQRPPAEQQQPPAPHWSDSGRRYDDLLRHFSGNQGEAYAPSRFNNLSRPDTLEDDDDRRPSPGRAAREEEPTPSSAPPYPYEGDLDDAAAPYRPPVAQPRPAPPGIRRNEPARHALDPTPPEGLPHLSQPSAAEPPRVRGPYDPVTFPRRLPYESPSPAATSAPPAEPAGSYAYTDQPSPAEQAARGLPQRVPAKPDVPTVPEPPSAEPSAETPELARIASHLRRGDVLPPQERQEGFDVQAILAAVREVEGVRDALLRTTPAGANSLRLDLAEGADPAEVSRQVARLLQDRMGLDAAMQGAEPVPPPAYAARPPAQPLVPSQPGPADPIAGSAPSPPPDLRRLPTVPQEQPRETQRDLPREPHFEPEPEPDPEETSPPGPLDIGHEPGPRVMIDNVQVTTFGTEASVEVRLVMDGRSAKGVASGPAVDAYLLRLCASATTEAINDLLTAADQRPDGPARCFVEHAGAVSFGASQVAVVVLLLSTGGWVEQLAGSAMAGNDARHAMVRATLAATNRRLEALLSR